MPMSGEPVLVTVAKSVVRSSKPSVKLGNRVIDSKVIGHDPVSRLEFFKIDGPATPKSMEWLDSVGDAADSILHASTPTGTVKGRTNGWVKQVGGKILPLALMRVNFDRNVPPPGTPLLDSAGRVAAIVFQESGTGNSGYAIPAEAVHRVRRDVCNGGRLIRGWLGLSLRAETQSPQIVRILPKSPALAAGVRPGDVLLSVGSRRINDYADAANAFFYLIPGEPVRIKVLRGVEPMEFTLTPTEPQAE